MFPEGWDISQSFPKERLKQLNVDIYPVAQGGYTKLLG
jgi:hypothetical protein